MDTHTAVQQTLYSEIMRLSLKTPFLKQAVGINIINFLNKSLSLHELFNSAPVAVFAYLSIFRRAVLFAGSRCNANMQCLHVLIWLLGNSLGRDCCRQSKDAPGQKEKIQKT